MKKTVFLIVFLFVFPALSFGASVSGYWKDTNHDGMKDTYVQPHQRTNPNSTVTDNYSHPGNYNPNTGAVTPTPRNSNPYDTFSNPYKKSPYAQ
jgi:hypothetical protein